MIAGARALWVCLVLPALPVSAATLFDPTQPYGGASVEVAPGGPALQSTHLSASGRRAVISGRQVSVGDRIGKQVVVEILPYEVVLRPEGGGAETRLRMLPRLDKEPVRVQGTNR